MSEVVYQADGATMTGYLARPTGLGPWPAVLIAHDGVGLEAYQRGRADALAAEGYIAFAMDYHGGEVFLGRPGEMLARTLPLLADVERMRTIGRVALDRFFADPDVDPNWVGAIGYGAGGRIVLELARTSMAFRAIALIHPALPAIDDANWAMLSGSFLLCIGSGDPIVTADQVLTFGNTLQKAGLDWRAHIYGGAKHAFWAKEAALAPAAEGTMPTVPGVGYHAEHAARAWRAVLDHLNEAKSQTPASDLA